MKVIWYIYGDVFATHPGLTIGTAVGNNLTQIPWNTPTEANGQHHADAPNPLGMTTRNGDPGITQSWQDKRVIDFGDTDDNTWIGNDIYIDDADNPIGDIDLTVRVIGNDSQTAIMRLAQNNGVNWFSADPQHNWYDQDYRDSADAWNMARLLHGGDNNYTNDETGIDYGWHARNANPQNWREFVIYKLLINTQTSRNNSVFISNTTGVGQTIAQRFSGAIEYDNNNADHQAVGQISDNPHDCLRTKNANGATGFQSPAGADIGSSYLNGVIVEACAGPPAHNILTKPAQDYNNISLDQMFGDADTMDFGSPTGFRSMNWTNYDDTSPGEPGYTVTRNDLVTYYDNGGQWTIPDGDDEQSCPYTTTGDNVSANTRLKQSTFLMMHAENAGITQDNNPSARPFGSDLNMIIPNPSVPPGPPMANPPGTVFDPDQPDLRQAYFDDETFVHVVIDDSGSMTDSIANIKNGLQDAKDWLRESIWDNNFQTADSQLTWREDDNERWVDWFADGDPDAAADGKHVVVAYCNEADDVYHDEGITDGDGNAVGNVNETSQTITDLDEPLPAGFELQWGRGRTFREDVEAFEAAHDAREQGHYALMGFPYNLRNIGADHITHAYWAIFRGFDRNNPPRDGWENRRPLGPRNVSISASMDDPITQITARDQLLNYLGQPYPSLDATTLTWDDNDQQWTLMVNNNTPHTLRVQFQNNSTGDFQNWIQIQPGDTAFTGANNDVVRNISNGNQIGIAVRADHDQAQVRDNVTMTAVQ